MSVQIIDMPSKTNVILVRYSEIALKTTPVRVRLVQNVISRINKEIPGKTKSDWGHIYVYPKDFGQAIAALQKMFGIVSVSPAVEVGSDFDEICTESVALANEKLKKNQSFAIRSRREGTHSYTSREIAITVGDLILKKNKAKKVSVDLTNPDLEIFIEVRGEQAYLYTKKILCPGGLPLGSQGKVAAIIKDEKSVVAAWLMMKRGCDVLLVAGVNEDDGKKKNDVIKKLAPIVKPLKDWGAVTDIYEGIGEALKRGAKIIVTGETLAEIDTTKKDLIPVLRPLIAMDDFEIAHLAKAIGIK